MNIFMLNELALAMVSGMREIHQPPAGVLIWLDGRMHQILYQSTMLCMGSMPWYAYITTEAPQALVEAAERADWSLLCTMLATQRAYEIFNETLTRWGYPKLFSEESSNGSFQLETDVS